jgi:hypothetical protein
MKQHVSHILIGVVLLLLAIVVTWRVTIGTLSVTKSGDTYYVTSFGQTDSFH